MLRDSVAVAVVVVRSSPRAIPLAMITMKKFIDGFPFLSHMSMGLRLAVLRARRSSAMKGIIKESGNEYIFKVHETLRAL